MKDYVIINGTNSNTITGLAINLLPPISKPPLRVMTEEIDGRDGDINTDLGYGAYDKTITIGLWGTTYDINTIIAFFNGEGTIVFSNETDKYYNYKIIEQVDYEKLLKFKTASVTFHCQPFKYPLTETPIEIINEYVEGEGENINLNNTKASTMKIDLKGNTSQTGTPTPSSPIDVNVVSGDNEVVVTGSQLLSINDISSTTTNGITYSVQNNIVTLNGTSTGIAYIGLYLNNTIASGTTFSYSANNPVANTNVSIRPAYNNSALETTRLNEVNKIRNNYTLSSDMNRIYIVIENGETLSNFVVKLMANIGTTAIPYEPYTSQSYPINFGSLELCKIGTYQDYIYKDSGKWYLHKEVGKVVLNGSENWDYVSGSTVFYTTAITDYATSNNTPYSNYYNGISNVNGSGAMGGASNNTIAFINISGGTTPRFYVKDTRYTSTTDLKTWLGTNQPIVYYVLATATETEITDTTLINQLEALKGAMSYEGQTNISQVNNDLPFILSASALKTGSGEAVVNNIGNIYAKPTIDIEGTGTIGIYKNGVQHFEVDMSNDNEIIIDTESMEAYYDGILKNRKVIGDYNKFTIDKGNNNIEVTGNITSATITNYTRWL